MKNLCCFKKITREIIQRNAACQILGAVFLLLGSGSLFAQTTNALDSATDPAYSGEGAPNGLSPGGQNGGFGFSPWTFTVNGNGGAFVAGSGPSGASWDLWNVDANSTTVAVRPLASPLAAGESFSVSLQLNSLDFATTTNALVLEDANGDSIFSYWHVGYEPDNGADGSYADATTNAGVAVGFSYNYQQFCSFTFTLNSATTYTFTDNTTGHSFSGVIAGGPIAQVAFVRGNGPSAPGNGQDFQFDELEVVASAPVGFSLQTPGAGSFSASTTNAISVQAIAGGTAINAASIAFKLDGTNVTPTVTTSLGITTISYLPSAPLSAGALHTVQVTLADNHNDLFTNTWSFMTGFPSLPAVLPGSIVVSNSDIVIFNAAGNPWLGTNYGSSSSRTIYVRFSMEFDNLNGETGNGGGYGGLHFFEGTTGHLIVGNNWPSLNWSADPSDGSTEPDLNPVTAVVFGEWHTIVERVDYSPGQNATVNIWLDPDFTQTEANQPNGPLTINTSNDTFDSIHLRTGNGTASATFSNIVIAATSAGAGFVAPAEPQFQGFLPGMNAPSAPVNTPVTVEVLFGSYGIGSNAVTMTLDGNAVTPTFAVATNAITVTYQTPTPYPAGSQHTAVVSVTDSNGAPYSTSWSFNVDSYPTLPVTLAGPYEVSGADVILFSNQNGWIGGNYQTNSTNVLYTRFSMTFDDVNGETGSGGAYGGLEFFEGTTERLLTGNNWLSTNWSTGGAGAANGQLPNADIPPVTPIVPGDWHTMVIKSSYSVNASNTAAIEVWLDPDFTKSEAGQPNPPLTLTLNNTFDNVRLRCGNGTAYAEFTNIVMAATGPAVGFAAPGTSTLLSIRSAGGVTQLSWTGNGTLQVAPAVTGPWSDSANQSNPQALSTTNTMQFYRTRQ